MPVTIPQWVGGAFPGGSAGKESSCNMGDLGLSSELGRSPGEGKRYPLQNSGLENSMDCTVHGVAKSQTQLNNLQVPHSLNIYFPEIGHKNKGTPRHVVKSQLIG